MTLNTIRQKLMQNHFEFSRHAFKRAVERNISDIEISQAAEVVEIIEDYPDDKHFPSCLLLGFTHGGRPLHIQASRADTEFVKIITLYEPDEIEWINYAKRRS